MRLPTGYFYMLNAFPVHNSVESTNIHKKPEKMPIYSWDRLSPRAKKAMKSLHQLAQPDSTQLCFIDMSWINVISIDDLHELKNVGDTTTLEIINFLKYNGIKLNGSE